MEEKKMMKKFIGEVDIKAVDTSLNPTPQNVSAKIKEVDLRLKPTPEKVKTKLKEVTFTKMK